MIGALIAGLVTLNGVRCESLRSFINSSFHMRSLQLVLKIVLPDTRVGVIFR
jgi:hypothetical protein